MFPAKSLRTAFDRGVLWVTIDHPPLNLLDESLISEIESLLEELAERDDVAVAVWRSADPDFFLAHVDVSRIGDEPSDAPPRGADLGRWHTMCERMRCMPIVTIGMVQGRARGGGSELLLAMDMVFAARDSAVFAQPEIVLGIIPGGGGAVRLPRLVGRARALEIVLGGHDFPAEVAAEYGWINRAIPDEELEEFVRALAERIARFPRAAIRLAKQAVDAGCDEPLEEALLTELWAFNQTLATAEARKLIISFVREFGQSRESELHMDVITEYLYGSES